MRTFVIITGLLAAGAATAAESARSGIEREVRGIGTVSATVEEAPGGTHVRYRVSDGEGARRLASKRLADLVGFGGLVQAGPGLAELPGTGFWRIAVDGAQVHELQAATREAIEAAGDPSWRPAELRAHPRWLDGFDQAAFGFWSLGGGVLPRDLDADLRWFGENGFTICAVGTNEDRVVAPGVVDSSILDFYRAKAAQYDVPWRMLLWWQHPQRPRYTWNLEPLPHVTTAAGGVAVDHPRYQRLAAYAGFEPVPSTDAYLADARAAISAIAGADPNFIGHHGTAEVPRANPLELAGVAGSPHVQALWRQWLREDRGWSLAEVGQRHRGDAGAFAGWDAVPIPGMEDYVAGRDPLRLAGGTWQVRCDPGREGQAAGWGADEGDMGWQVRDIRDPALLLFGQGADGKPAGPWYRRRFEIDPAQAGRLRFLHLNRTGWHGTDSAVAAVWINGVALTSITDDHPVHPDHDQCFAVGEALRPGLNTLTIDGRGCTLSGHVLLSDQGRWSYPSADPALNARWYDSTEFCRWLRLRWLGDALAATRRGDPWRPQKIMAPWQFIGDALDLGERWGAYIHETGLGGACWTPMFPRYAQARRQPTSSEPGGPAEDAFSLKRFVTSYLMMGDDAVDIVFHAEQYRTKPELAEWIADNRELLRCIGKSVIPVPPVAVLRSTRAIRLGQEAPWSWDLTRGEFQSVGRDGVDIEVEDLVTGRIDPAIRVLFDAGTTVMTTAEVAAIARWVEAGGVFVALHNTGMHTPEGAGTWPITALTGMRVVGGPIGGRRIRFSAQQDLWPGLAGRELMGWGTVLDWLDRDRSGSSVALAPAADGIEALATWEGAAGPVAVARRRLGRGQVVTLGSTFWRNAKDDSGRYVATTGARPYLDELLGSLGIPRISTVMPVTPDTVLAFRWRSKNGVFDVYPVARMDTRKEAQPISVDVTFAGRTDAAPVVELSALGRPRRAAEPATGGFTLRQIGLATMQARVFAVPRSDQGRAGIDWLDQLADRWRPIAPPPPAVLPERRPDLLPLADGWRVGVAERPWSGDPCEPSAVRTLRLGSCAAMGIDPEAVVQAVRTVEIPAAWAGRRLRLVFNAEDWFWGLGPSARLWVDGRPAAVRQPIVPDHRGSFVVDLGQRPAGAVIALALEIDGRQKPGAKRPRPAGATGIFCLEAWPLPIESLDLLPGLRLVGRDGVAGSVVNPAGPCPSGTQMLETAVPAQAQRQGTRLFLEWDDPVERLQVGSTWLEPPGWMRRLDVSRLVAADRPTVLRLSPSVVWPLTWARNPGRPPGLRLVRVVD